LLAYDSSPKAEEALFVATYLAGRWGISLGVVSVNEAGFVASEALAQAHTYLESRGVQATSISRDGSVPEAILGVAEEQENDLIIMGGYGHHPVREIVLGSAVDHILQVSRQPTLVCR
jgi:nucleotide-binding universal stress UspA family protein